MAQTTEEMWESKKERIRRIYLGIDRPGGKDLSFRELLEMLNSEGVFATFVPPAYSPWRISDDAPERHSWNID